MTRTVLPDVRSAAVATIYEADSQKYRETVLALRDDPNETVRGEVLEYLGEYAEIEDMYSILAMFDQGASAFGVTSALSRLVPQGPGVVLEDDDTEEKVSKIIEQWKTLVAEHRHGAT